MPLELHRLSRSYPATQALADVTLSLPEGRVLGLLGPSGSGKSTLLRLVAGLEQPDGGSISLAGTDLTRVPARARNFGVVRSGEHKSELQSRGQLVCRLLLE